MSWTPQDFLGRWRIDRRIREEKGAAEAIFSGVSTIEVRKNEWEYSEKGTIALPQGGCFQAERRYLWRPQGGVIDIYFEDGRYFHTMELAAQAKDAHWCDPDQYDVEYDFRNWPVWISTWDVRGPRKNYKMTSKYQRDRT